MATYFVFPFATAGDVAPIPNPTTGVAVSYQSGFTSPYSLPSSNPSSLPVPRTQFNQLMFDITSALQQYQAFGVYPFITASDNDGAAFAYSIYARCRYDDGSGAGPQLYESLVNSNTQTPGVTASQWRIISQPSLPIGAIIDFAGTTPPTGYLLCDGSTVSTTTYANLFAVIGNTWNGSPPTGTFGLPDLRRRVTVGSGGTLTAVLGNVVGDLGGEEAHVQTLAEMANHAHAGSSASVGGDQSVSGVGSISQKSDDAAIPIAVTLSIAAAGNSTAANIIQPSAVTNKYIKYA
jgi:microcystin-dependent protein